MAIIISIRSISVNYNQETESAVISIHNEPHFLVPDINDISLISNDMIIKILSDNNIMVEEEDYEIPIEFCDKSVIDNLQ